VSEDKDVKKLLSSRYRNLRVKWERTKKNLLENRLLRGLNFKPWPDGGGHAYSVRVDDNFRAHLRHRGSGVWEAYDIGPHKIMGHG